MYKVRRSPFPFISLLAVAIVVCFTFFLSGAQDTLSAGFSLLQSKAFYDVKDFGAEGNDEADDTEAIQKAIDIARAKGGIVWVPPGVYRISSLDLTDTTRGVFIQGAGVNSTRFVPIRHNVHVLDLTGSAFIHLRDFQIGAYNQEIVPYTAILLAQKIKDSMANALHFEGLYVSGRYSIATIYDYGVPSSSMMNCDFYNYYQPGDDKGVPVAVFASNNIFDVTSEFIEIAKGRKLMADWTFVGCEFHSYRDVYPPSGLNWNVTLDDLMSMRFVGGNMDNYDGPSAIRISGTVKDLYLDGVDIWMTEAESHGLFLEKDSLLEGVTIDPGFYSFVSEDFVAGVGSLKAESGNQILIASTEPGNAIQDGETVYLCSGGQGKLTEESFNIVSERGTLNTLIARAQSSPGTGQKWEIRVLVNGEPTELSCTIEGDNSISQDFQHRALVKPGDMLSFEVKASANAMPGYIAISVGLLKW